MVYSFKNFISIAKSEWSFFFLFLALYVEQGVSFGKFSLFHIAIVTFLVKNSTKIIIERKNLFLKQSIPFHIFFLVIFLTSFMNSLNLIYMYYYGFVYLVFLIFWFQREFIITHYSTVLYFLFFLFTCDLFLSLLEFISPFRYPISRLSEYNHFFGRNYNFFKDDVYCFDLNYVLSTPTGFHWNQNNLAFILLIMLLFTMILRNKIIRNLMRVLILILVLATGSRIGFITSCIVLLFFAYWEIKNREWLIIIPLFVSACILTDGFYVFPFQSKKIKEVAIISQSIFTDKFPDQCYQKKNSEETRLLLNAQCVSLIKEKLIFGRGAGGLNMELIKYNESKKHDNEKIVTNGHNFLLELLVDFGSLIIIPIILIFFNLFYGVKKRGEFDIVFLMIFIVIIFAGSVMISSMVYFLPFYSIFFIYYILATSNLQKINSI